jgi:YrhK-like protein
MARRNISGRRAGERTRNDLTEWSAGMWLRAIRRTAYEYPWFHRWMGAIGNTSFVVGSVFFLSKELQIIGTWIFIFASSGMMVDSFGEKMVKSESQQRRSAAVPGSAGAHS